MELEGQGCSCSACRWETQDWSPSQPFPEAETDPSLLMQDQEQHPWKKLKHEQGVRAELEADHGRHGGSFLPLGLTGPGLSSMARAVEGDEALGPCRLQSMVEK